MNRHHDRIAGLVAGFFGIGPAEALAITRDRETAKIRAAWEYYTRYKGPDFSPNISRDIRNAACRKAALLVMLNRMVRALYICDTCGGTVKGADITLARVDSRLNDLPRIGCAKRGCGGWMEPIEI